MDPHPTAEVATSLGPFHLHLLGRAGPWVVCWPSMMGDHRSMQEFAQRLQDRHRVVLIDPPGFGVNRAIDRWPDLTGLAALAHQIVDALDMHSFHWVGQGHGGHVGAALAARVGYRMGSLCMSSVPFVTTLRIKLMSRLVSSVLYRTASGRRLVTKHLSEQMATSKPREARLVFDQMLAAQMDCNLAVLNRLWPTPAPLLIKLRERLVPVRIPTLVLAGQWDTLVLPRDQQTLAEVLNARYEVVDSGFMTFLAQPAACARHLLAFLADHPRPARE